MTKSVGASLQAHIEGETTTLATCWKIERRDSTVLGFTDYVEDLEIDSVTYVSTAGYYRTAIAQREGLNVDNADVLGVIDADEISEDDLLAGLYRDAKVWLFQVNYANLTQGIIKLDYGFLGEVTVRGQTFIAEFRSLTARLAQPIGSKYSRYCRWQLGDSNCGVNLASYTTTGTVTSVSGSLPNSVFTDTSITDDNDYYQYGTLTWTGGNNDGQAFDVKDSTSAGVITLRQATFAPIQVGDTFSITAGCNHALKMPGDTKGSAYTGDCRAKFNNVANFGGEPEIPTIDRLSASAGKV